MKAVGFGLPPFDYKRNQVDLMRNRMLTVFLIMILALSFAGCKGKEPSTDAPADSTTEAEKERTLEQYSEIADQEGNIIGKIERGVSVTACDAGLFYCVFRLGEYETTATAEYRFFRTEDRKDIRLGTLSDQGYEASFVRTELNGMIYTLAVTGNPLDYEKDTLWLLAFDPMKETMQQFMVTEYGFPYTAMTASNGKLYIMNHEQDAKHLDKIYEFDPASGTVKEVLTYQNDKDSLRSVAAAEDGFYVLNLRIKNEGNELWLERYDLSYSKVSEQSVNEVMADAALRVAARTRDDVRNEFGMMVSGFAVIDGRYLFYENFGTIRLAVDLQGGEALFSETDIYSMSHGSGQKLFYRLSFLGDEIVEPEIHIFRNGAFMKMTFDPKDDRTHLQGITISPKGTWAIVMTNSEAKDENGVDLITLFRE